MKEKHLRLRLKQSAVSIPALGWDWAQRAKEMAIEAGTHVDVAYRLRRNEHPDFGGLELEIVDLRLANS
jgi:single-stranded-DNA-specific exonuclease